MRRGILAILAVILFIASGSGAAMRRSDPDVFERPPSTPRVVLGDTDLILSDMAAADLSAALAAAPNPHRVYPDVDSVRGKKTGEHIPYGLVLIASRLHESPDPGAEAAELTTTLMIGLGLITVGLFRRFYSAA